MGVNMGVNMSLIISISFVVFGAHLLALSFSKSTYQKLQKDNGEKFANKVTKGTQNMWMSLYFGFSNRFLALSVVPF
jgi:hypothetical protein